MSRFDLFPKTDRQQNIRQVINVDKGPWKMSLKLALSMTLDKLEAVRWRNDSVFNIECVKIDKGTMQPAHRARCTKHTFHRQFTAETSTFIGRSSDST
jgi:hypothetical protein